MPKLELKAQGLPRPQPRARFNFRRSRCYSNTKIISNWKMIMAPTFRGQLPKGFKKITTPISISLTFKFARPLKHYIKGQPSVVKEEYKEAKVVSATRGDGDNLEKPVWDTLTKAEIFRDDCLIYRWTGEKIYVDTQEEEGVVVAICYDEK